MVACFWALFGGGYINRSLMFWAAFITGIIGSLHCTGMCGPLMCVMPINKHDSFSEISGLLVYNTGRIISYAILGLVIGSAGATISAITGAWFGYIGGAFLCVLGIYKLVTKKNNEIKMPTIIRKWMGKLFKKRSPFTLPLLGMLNGIIPCGAVYAALAGAAVVANPLDGALYMLIFGLATWPAIFSSYYLTNKLVKFFKGYYRPTTSIFLLLMGIMLLYRSANGHQMINATHPINVCE